MRSLRMHPLGFVLCVFSLSAASLAFCQGITTGTVSGTVADPSGAVIPGAQVQLTNQANGLKLVEESPAEGAFKFSAVPIGAYRAVITANGFANEASTTSRWLLEPPRI